MFKLAALSPRVKRVYFYHWAPAPTTRPTWDSALVDRRTTTPARLQRPLTWLRQARHRALLALSRRRCCSRGCGGTTSEGGISGGGKVIGRTVTVYSLTSDPAGANRDFVDAREARALGRGRARRRARGQLHLARPRRRTTTLQAEAVRRAITDPQIIAAIVDATPVTVPLFNAAGLLQVAPGGDPSLASDPNALPSGKRTVGALGDGAAPADFDARFQRGVRPRARARAPRTATAR